VSGRGRAAGQHAMGETRSTFNGGQRSTTFNELSAELLGRGNRIRFRAAGRSMAPAIRDGDILTIEPARPDGLRVGDVALHRVGEAQLVAHRVVARRVEGGHLVLATRGDALLDPPHRVGEGDVLGRVIERERNGRVVRIGRGLRRAAARLLVTLLALRRAAARLRSAARRLAARLRRP